MDVIRAPAVAECRGRSDSTQKLDSTGDLREEQDLSPPRQYPTTLSLACYYRGQQRDGGRGPGRT